ARMMERMRQEAGIALGAITDDELRVLVEVRLRHQEIGDGHQPGRFDGDALLFSAAQGRRDGAPTAELWEGYVSGAITEIRVPCTHSDMVRPDMLAQVWSGISAQLGLGES